MRGYYRHTKIIATVGPATESPEKLGKLILAGLDVMRLNMAHGTDDWVRSLVTRIREVSVEVQRHVAVMMDVKGPEIRTGVVAEPIELKAGDCLRLTQPVRAMACVGSTARIIAKIEDQGGLRNLADIIKVADAVMVARGDLGIEIAYHTLSRWRRRASSICV